jgi:PAS domain S-box-containing protein
MTSPTLFEISDPLALLEGLFEHSPVPYAVFAVSGHCVLTNPAYREMFGVAPPPEYNIFRDEVTARLGVAELVSRAFTGETVHTPTFWYDPRELQHADGSGGKRIAISCTLFPLRSSDAITHVAIAYKDVTTELTLQQRAESERDVLRDLLGQASSAEGGETGAASILFRRVVESVSDGITVQDARGRLVYANDAAARISGFRSAAEFLAAPVEELQSRFEMLDVFGKPFPWDRLPARLALRGEEPLPALVRIKDRLTGGEWRTLIRASAIGRVEQPEFVVNVFHDVTEVTRSQEALKYLSDVSALLSQSVEYEEVLTQLAQLMVPRLADWCSVIVLEDDELRQVAVAHVDAAKVEIAKEYAARFPPDPNARFGVAEVIRSGTAELYPDVSDELLARGARDAEHLHLMRQVGMRSVILVPLVARARTIGCLNLVSAESGRRYDQRDLDLAKELGRRAGAFVDNAWVYEGAQRAVRARDEFLAIAAHELKTPLAALLLRLETLKAAAEKSTDGGGPMADRAGKALSYGQRLNRLVDELLDVARITSEPLVLHLEAVDFRALAQDVAERFEQESLRVGSPINVHGESGVSCAADRPRMERLLTNLLANALKYGPGKPVGIDVSSDNGSVRIAVQDQGMGIAKADQVRIFQRFERAVPTRNFGGLGLGLWIARQIAEAHGGRILVESAPGQGSTFTVELPCDPR